MISTERIGKITASNVHKLLGKDDAKFTEAGMTYLRELIAQSMTGEMPEEVSTAAIRWGNDNEPHAVAAIVKRWNPSKLVYFGGENPKFFRHPLFPRLAGCSPDVDMRVEYDGAEHDAVGEVKCPYNSAVHVRNLEIVTPEELAKEHPDYYAQIQMQIACLDYDMGVFFSFDPRNMKYPLHRIFVPRDEAFQTKLTAKIKLAQAKIAELKTIIEQNQKA